MVALACCLGSAVARSEASPSRTTTKKHSKAHSRSSKKTASHHKSSTTHTSTARRRTSGKSSSRTTSSRRSRSRKRTARARGQQKIDSDRTTQIQQALIRQHYLTGDPSGSWDASTEAALRKYQADHGWQNKVVPDSRALIGLGLGPSKDHLLNPDSAMTSGTDAPASTALHATSHSPSPAANGSAAGGSSSNPTASRPAPTGDNSNGVGSSPAAKSEPQNSPQGNGPQ